MTKKIVLTILLVGMSLAPAFAGAGIPNNSRGEYSGVLNSTGAGTYVVKASPGLVYSMSIISTSSNGSVTLFDTTTTTTTGLTPVYEAASATTGTQAAIDMSGAPMNFYNGIVVKVSNGDAYVNYQ